MSDRTPLNPENTTPIMVRLTPEQREALQDEADAAGMPLGGWMRTICLAAAGSTRLAEQIGRAKGKRDELRRSRKKSSAGKGAR